MYQKFNNPGLDYLCEEMRLKIENKMKDAEDTALDLKYYK